MSKGSKRRPMTISDDQFAQNWERAFHARCSTCPRCLTPGPFTITPTGALRHYCGTLVDSHNTILQPGLACVPVE